MKFTVVHPGGRFIICPQCNHEQRLLISRYAPKCEKCGFSEPPSQPATPEPPDEGCPDEGCPHFGTPHGHV